MQHRSQRPWNHHLGSTILTVDAGGAVRNRYTYWPFGDPGVIEGATVHHQYVGAEKLEVAPYAIGPRLDFWQLDPGLASSANEFGLLTDLPLIAGVLPKLPLDPAFPWVTVWRARAPKRPQRL